MKWKFLIAILFFIALIPLVNSLAFTQNEEGEIVHAVRVGGGLPGSSTNCNISIFYSNGSNFIDFDAMTNSNDVFNYTLNNSQTTIIGKYNYAVSCTNGNLNDTKEYEFFINPGGVEPSQSRTDSLTRTIYFLFGISILFFIAFLFTNGKENITLKYSFILLSLLFFLISTNTIFISLQDEISNPRLINFFSSFTRISFILYWFIGFLLMAIWVLTFFVTIFSSMKDKTRRRLEG